MKPKFTGHDTFPLRYGWLFKAINLINNKGLLSSSDPSKAAISISALGVGKNMVNAIKYWSEATQVISSGMKDRAVVQDVTPLGAKIFDESTGVDPYLEDIGTIWLLHFVLNFEDSNLTAYRYFFNYSNNIYFEKTKFVEDLFEDAGRLTTSDSFKAATVKKDVDCFLSTYTSKSYSTGGKKGRVVDEDHFLSPLSELGLLRDLGRGFYQCELDDRPTLPLQIFIYALIQYFHLVNQGSNVNQVSFEDILSRPLSPGRIFKLSEAALGRLLDESVTAYKSDITWVDSLGLKQVSISQLLLDHPEDLLDDYYR
ncbi:MAG: DUF4007 family protein [Motiliproteus sp.]|nr:DUF4007 family protein [Motiliproteus sp.]MCW9053510.1 DUF4007 family protein [Motiliproteus sp.]